MVKKLLSCNFILLLMPLIILAEIAETKFNITMNSFYYYMFKDQIEHIYFIMIDGVILHNTSNYHHKVAIPFDFIEQLKNKGYKVSDIIIVIHNHVTPSRISEGDIKQWNWLRSKGFRGDFLIYYQTPKPHIIVYKDKK